MCLYAFSTFHQMLELSGLGEQLILTGAHLTIFAPNNDAFETMDTALVEGLLNIDNDKDYLKSVGYYDSKIQINIKHMYAI